MELVDATLSSGPGTGIARSGTWQPENRVAGREGMQMKPNEKALPCILDGSHVRALCNERQRAARGAAGSAHDNAARGKDRGCYTHLPTYIERPTT
jgi:hypothetical protein